MVTYEVTATVRPDLVAAYERYMREAHIPDLLATGAFVAASLSRAGPGRFRIRYEAADREALDEYLATHAGRLRADFLRHFPEGVELTREEWAVLQQWTAPRPPAPSSSARTS